MDSILETFAIESWNSPITQESQQIAIQALEQGKVLYLPKLSFPLSVHETQFLSPHIVDRKSKNISYDLRNDHLGGFCLENEEMSKLKAMMKRYAMDSRSFFEKLFPSYSSHFKQARTSFRPVEASGRTLSARKDDTRLHVDSFPANPVKGQRILRIFTNVNPEGKPRVWRIGEPFENVVQKIAPRARKHVPGVALLLKMLRITKEYRTLYDHYMLQIHDTMKMDESYQKSVKQKEVRFPSGSSWVVYTDQVSHAAMSGQHLFEQTFHLPLEAMQNEHTTPQRVLEKFFRRALV